MSRRSGLVWWQGRTVGSPREDEHGLLHLAYHQEWLEGSGFPVSVSLPLLNEDAEVDAHSYFSGLLPEGRSHCQRYNIRYRQPFLSAHKSAQQAFSLRAARAFIPGLHHAVE